MKLFNLKEDVNPSEFTSCQIFPRCYVFKSELVEQPLNFKKEERLTFMKFKVIVLILKNILSV